MLPEVFPVFVQAGKFRREDYQGRKVTMGAIISILPVKLIHFLRRLANLLFNGNLLHDIGWGEVYGVGRALARHVGLKPDLHFGSGCSQ